MNTKNKINNKFFGKKKKTVKIPKKNEKKKKFNNKIDHCHSTK